MRQIVGFARAVADEIWCKTVQAIVLLRIPADSPRLVVFLVPGYNWRSGGILSITSLYRESVRLRHCHGAYVALCTIPGDPTLLRYSWFRNRDYIVHFEDVLRRCDRVQSVLLHVPEYAVNRMRGWLASDAAASLRSVGELRINVLLQNVDQVQGQNVTGLRDFGYVSCTTAHEAYSTQAFRNVIGVTLHRLSVFIDPSQYSKTSYSEKQPLLIVSPDAHPYRERILQSIAQAHPQIRIKTIRDMTYEQYKEIIRQAKWSLTFGEGLDGYFAEPIFSGGVSFAVFNDRFFTQEFRSLRTVYPSWEIAAQSIAADLGRLDRHDEYKSCWRGAFDLLSAIYQVDRYRENLRRFYARQYTFP